MIDIHCHLLPGVDDGAQTLSDSILMARALVELGFQQVCCTPHRPWSGRSLPAAVLNRQREELSGELARERIPLTLHRGAEHMAVEVPALLDGDDVILYPRGDSLLMEFGMGGFPPRVADLLFRLQVRRLTPVLAHVERIPEVQADPLVLEPLRQRGCAFLVNLSSLAGGWDRPSQQAARALVRRGLVDAVTTDLHTVAEVPVLVDGLARLGALVGDEDVARLTGSGPAGLAGLTPVAGGA